MPAPDPALIADGPPPALRRAVLAWNAGLAQQAWLPLQGGRSNRVWRVADLAVKLYDPAAESPLFPNDSKAEAQALRQLGPLGLAPVLLAEGADWLVYRHVPGQLWSGDPVPVAALLARVHGLRGEGFRMLASGSRALRDQAARILAGCTGSLPAPPETDMPPVARPGLIHGDAVAGNVIDGRQGVVLIDWQCPAMGDPAEDIAAFLSPAMQFLYRGRPLDLGQEAAFLAACPAPLAHRYHALAPLFHWRMAAHCLWKAERGAADYAAALRLELARLG